ncbi:MAG: hypothetical protein IAE90_04970 [Ignavibacteria bacterium]|nr:hypothetical protein [Ignavibacteria bacterium]
MIDILFYILALSMIFSALVIAFGNDIRRIILFAGALILAFAAMLIVLKAQLVALALVGFAVITMILIAVYLDKHIHGSAGNINRKFRLMLLPVLAISAAAAMITSLSASTRWLALVESSYDYSGIFTKYLPLILPVVLLASLMLRMILDMLRKESQN